MTTIWWSFCDVLNGMDILYYSFSTFSSSFEAHILHKTVWEWIEFEGDPKYHGSLRYYNNHGCLCGSDTGEKAGNCCKSPGKDYNISRELSCYLKRQSIYQNNLYNTNDTADLWLYGPQWKTKKIGFWMCTVPDGARRTRVEGIVQLIPIMKSLDK